MLRSIFALLLVLTPACSRTKTESAAPALPPVTPSQNPSQVVLSGADEPGERLTFTGRVLGYDGRPLSKAAVIAYHADKNGLYNPPNSPTRVPRLRGVAITGEDGSFQFSTVRPGPYPDGSEPAHIHMQVMAPAHRHRYVTIWFEGDPLITAEMQKKAASDPELIVVKPTRSPTGEWTFARDIRLEGS
jgi:protocatechuate 3,4-dioxygenase beta subunit